MRRSRLLVALLITIASACSSAEPDPADDRPSTAAGSYRKIAQSALSTTILVDTPEARASFGSRIWITVAREEPASDGRTSVLTTVETERDVLLTSKLFGKYSADHQEFVVDELQSYGPRSKARLWITLRPGENGALAPHVRLGDEWVLFDPHDPRLTESPPLSMHFNDLEKLAMSFVKELESDATFVDALRGAVGKDVTPNHSSSASSTPGAPGSGTASVQQALDCGPLAALGILSTVGGIVIAGGVAACCATVVACAFCVGGVGLTAIDVIECIQGTQATAYCEANCPLTAAGPGSAVCGDTSGCCGSPGTCVSPADYCGDACDCPPKAPQPADEQCATYVCQPNPARWERQPIHEYDACDAAPGPGYCSVGNCVYWPGFGVCNVENEGASNCDGYDNDCDMTIDEGCCPTGEHICSYQPVVCSENGACNAAPSQATCGHSECTVGGALAKSCSACASEICIQHPECCSPTGGWSQTCVEAAMNLPGPCAGECYDGQSSCPHSECMTGSALGSSCSSCAESVCKTDDFCCSNEWDTYCTWAAERDPFCNCEPTD